jgi:glycosyltransferase involved in cell wall biosynthesis
VLVLPSRWETLSYVCLEAQSCGVPVIATNIPGPNSIIKHGKTGFLIRPEESISLANAILRMHQIKRDSPHIFNEMKKSCRQNILERFSLEIEVKKITALFDFVSAH